MDRFVYPRSIRRRWRVFGRFGNVHRHGRHRLAERGAEMTDDVKKLQYMVRLAAIRLYMENSTLYPSVDSAVESLERAADQDIRFDAEKRPWFERYPLLRAENLA